MTLEPMNPYERRIIHSALANNADVKTISEGKEPVRYIAVIPNNANPNDRGLKYGRDDRRGGERRFNDRKPRGDRRGRDDRPRGGSRGGRPSGGGAKRGKKEIIFGTFLGNSGAKEEE